MTTTIRSADLDSEAEILLDILEANLTDLPHRRRFHWLYHENPAGPAWSWFLCEARTARVVGTASVFPRAVWIGGSIHLCGQVGDFAIDVSHRSLGPAVMLQRATFEPVDRGLLTFCYDCPPHDRGMAPFRRLRIEPTCRTNRYARLLRTERQVEKWLGRGRLAAALAAVANVALTVRSPRRSENHGIEITEHDGRFGEEFSVLDREVAESEIIRNGRSSEDLNWRYRDDPLRRYDVLTARRHGELIAFVVFSTVEGHTQVVDLSGKLTSSVAVALLDAVAEQARQKSTQTLQIVLTDRDDLTGVLAKANFRCRSEGPRVVAYARPGSEARALLDQPLNWFLRPADLLA